MNKHSMSHPNISGNFYVHDLSNIVSKGIIYRAIKGKEILFFQKGASVFTCPLNWKKIEIRYVHELQHLLFGLKLNSEMEI